MLFCLENVSLCFSATYKHTDMTLLTHRTAPGPQGELKKLNSQANFLTVSSRHVMDRRNSGKGDSICVLLSDRWHSRSKAQRICMRPSSHAAYY